MVKIWKIRVMTAGELDRLLYERDRYKSYWALWETEQGEADEDAEAGQTSPEISL